MVCRAPSLKISMRSKEHKQESIYISDSLILSSQQCFKERFTMFYRYVPDMFLDRDPVLANRPRNFHLLPAYALSSHQICMYVSVHSFRDTSL
jgi:hypothetical protein